MFAVRGGIIDVFPSSSPDPYRLEFFGNEIESLRIYDPIGQKSIRAIEKVEILAAVELELLQQSTIQASLLDYLGAQTLVILDDLLSLEDRYASLLSLSSHNRHFSTFEEFLDQIAPFQKIFLTEQPVEELSEVKFSPMKGSSFYSKQVAFHSLSFEIFNRQWSVKRWQHPFQHDRSPSFS